MRTSLPASVEDALTSARLNQSCHCIAVNPQELEQSIARGSLDPQLAMSLRSTHRNLFSSSPVFVALSQLHAMQSTVNAIEHLAQSEAFEERVALRLETAGLHPPLQRSDPLLSYDFHISDDGPKLIEVNTNPGGVLLGLHIQIAQEACCPEVKQAHYPLSSKEEVEQALVEMVTAAAPAEVKKASPLLNIAIVDDQPSEQFLYPEFVLYQRLFERFGHSVRIHDPGDLSLVDDRLTAGGWPIDVVYNRSTDFLLEDSRCAALRNAWQTGLVGLTPDPSAWSAFADKFNLAELSAPERFAEIGLDAEKSQSLRTTVPRTTVLCASNSDQLWASRKQLFFKPAAGHGSRGAYDGKKISRRKFDEICAHDYVAQQRIPPSTRTLLWDQTEHQLKLDLRCITWRGRVIMLMARLYRGQTTNMRTQGGGLATALVFSPEATEAGSQKAC